MRPLLAIITRASTNTVGYAESIHIYVSTLKETWPVPQTFGNAPFKIFVKLQKQKFDHLINVLNEFKKQRRKLYEKVLNFKPEMAV